MPSFPGMRYVFRWTLLGALVVFAAAGLAGGGELSVAFIDCGRGDAILIRTPAGENVLLDAGPSPQQARREGRPGAVRKYLRKAGVRRLDAAILSHGHPDHAGGFSSVIRSFPVKNFYESGRADVSPEYRGLQRTLRRKEIRRVLVKAGDVVNLDTSVDIQVLWPDETPPGGDLNDNSLVIRLTYGETSVLFPGDVGAGAEEALVRRYGESLESGVLKVPHHGLGSSASAGFLLSVKPEIAVICIGGGVQPDAAILERLSESGARVYRTDQAGTVRVVSDGKTWEVR